MITYTVKVSSPRKYWLTIGSAFAPKDGTFLHSCQKRAIASRIIEYTKSMAA